MNCLKLSIRREKDNQVAEKTKHKKKKKAIDSNFTTLAMKSSVYDESLEGMIQSFSWDHHHVKLSINAIKFILSIAITMLQIHRIKKIIKISIYICGKYTTILANDYSQSLVASNRIIIGAIWKSVC